MSQRPEDRNKPGRHTETSKRNHPRTGHPGRGMLYVMLALALLLIGLMVALYPMVMVGAPDTAIVRIPRNATQQMVSDSLTKRFGPDYASKVMRLIRMRHTDMSRRHGAYEIPEGSNALSAMRKLTSGAQTPSKFTLNGYRSMDRMLERIALKFDFSTDSLRNVLYDPKFLETYGLSRDNAMAIFINDSYEAYWSATPEQVLAKLGDNYARLWNEENTAKAKELGLRPVEVMILASIVDEETNAPSEKGDIARLYINRLNKGMRMQSDPTIRFALGDFTIRRIKGADLKVKSLYNTYMFAGLPPGPIRTVGRNTVESILNSKPNDYLYMCAKENFSGTHNFTSDYNEHLRNAQRYRQALDQRGIVR